MKTRILTLIGIVALLSFNGCHKYSGDEDDNLQTITKEFISDGTKDGYIEYRGSSFKPIINDYYSHAIGKALCTGWTANGNALRSFLSFDIAEIQPTEGQKLIIEEVKLSVYEVNTNMLPFTSDGKRAVECFLVNYGTLSNGSFKLEHFADCGIITTNGFNSLKEYPLIVTTPVADFIKANPTAKEIQFRLQFEKDISEENNLNELKSAMWLIFGGDEDSKTDYRPKLKVKYHYE